MTPTTTVSLPDRVTPAQWAELVFRGAWGRGVRDILVTQLPERSDVATADRIDFASFPDPT